MKNLFFLTSLMISGVTPLALAGGVDGGGGKSVVCRDSSGVIQTTEVLDLYEGRVMFGLNIQDSPEPMDVQIKNALSRIPANSRGLIEFYTGHVLKTMKLTPLKTRLLPIEDSFEVVAPQDCAVEQAANYYTDKTILVSGDIWSKLSETGKAALVLHEAVYAANRMVGATNSRQSRHIVASIFVPTTNWVDIKDQLPQNALTCLTYGGGLLMWAYQDENNHWNLQFQILGKSYVMSKKTLRIVNPQFDLNEAKNFPIVTGEDKVGLSITSSGATQSLFEDGDIISISKKWETIKDRQGNTIRGFQTPRYYLSWISRSFPNTSTSESLLNCSVQIP